MKRSTLYKLPLLLGVGVIGTLLGLRKRKLNQEHLNDSLVDAAWKGNREAVRDLLALGADANAKDSFGVTPLMWASGWGDPGLVQSLLTKGADVNACDNDGKTPLMWAREKGQDEAAALLKDAGASP